MTETAKLINRALHELIIDGIKYEPIKDQYYEMRLFEVWEEVAKLLDADDRVKFFCKLPRWFNVATPLGDYNPDWAVVVEDKQKLYLVRETKSTMDRDKRRESENKKVDCGKAHFNALGVNFKDAATIYEVLQA